MTILGIDEVGRGALAGPVVLGGVRITDDLPILCHHIEPHFWFEQNSDFTIVRDSKKLSQLKRERILEVVESHDIDNCILFCSSHLIDKFGIGICLSHMICILVNVLQADRIIIDGKIKILSSYNSILMEHILRDNKIKNNMKKIPTLKKIGNPNEITVERETKADDRYFPIALASIISKVKRDQLMQKLDQEFTQYGWKQNKGYGTAAHRAAISKNPNNPHLRKTFLSKILSQSSAKYNPGQG